nr:type I restriction endonuclease [uncultured Cellulosilyticum sp.]
MDFIDQLKQFSKRVSSLKDSIQTEEATKTSIIMPFFNLLGYDVFNPEEFVPEFTADVGIKKGEKVDYAIMLDGKPVILVEAKWIGEQLEKHDSQLFRYFGTSAAKFAILTNGIIYRFFTDLDEPNKMDETPFLEINILDIKESYVAELKKFHKSTFNMDEIIDTAAELKYSNEIKSLFAAQLQSPSDEFTKLFLSTIYSGMKTQNVIEKFRPIVKKALNQFITETMNEKLKTVLDSSSPQEKEESVEQDEEGSIQTNTKIITTPEELEAFFLIKNILKDTVSIDDITYKDTESYFAVLYKGKPTKWICRLILTDTQKVIVIPDENKKAIKYNLEHIYDIETYKEQLVDVLNRYKN